MTSKTKVINLFGGPGCGKSTCAAYVFAKLKMAGVNVELVTEFAKDKTWEHNNVALGCQPYVFGKQCYRLDRCADQVDVIVTDSPLLLTTLYNYDDNIEPEFRDMVLKKFNEFDNYNFFLRRWKKYNPIGRNQTEDEAKQLDCKIIEVLVKNKIEFESVEGRIDGFDSIIYKMIGVLNGKRDEV